MLMERMKLLQENQREEEGVTQEEMATRFELEKTESLLVPSSGEEVQGATVWGQEVPMGQGSLGREEGTRTCLRESRISSPVQCWLHLGSRPLRWCLVDILDPSLQSNIRCFLEDPEFGYKDFTRRGEQAPPTFRAQVGAQQWLRSGG